MSAKIPLPGMSAYCAAKAGLDVFSKCVGIEQGVGELCAVKMMSVWPGMIDTCLQEEARTADKETFTSAHIFAMAKERGMLASPVETADKIIEMLLGEKHAQGSVIEELYA